MLRRALSSPAGVERAMKQSKLRALLSAPTCSVILRRECLTADMKYAPLVLKHLRKNWIRTLSTVLAMSLAARASD